MKSIEIKAERRKEVGKKHSKILRKQGLVPCVLYGGEEIMHFSAPENEFRHIIYTHDVFLVNLNIDGKVYMAFLQEGQFHPVTDNPLHLDFIRVFEDKPAIVSLPVILNGSSVGIREGGKLRQRRRYLKVRGLVKDLPENLQIDISELNIGDFVKVEDLDYEHIELLDPARAMVVGVTTSRIAKGMEEALPEVEEVEEVEGEEGEEGEEGAEGAEGAAEGAEGAAEKPSEAGGKAPAKDKSEG